MIKRLDSFFNRVTGLGTTEDKATFARIAPLEYYTDQDLENLYRSNPYAGVIVDELAFEATRKGWKVQTTDESELYDSSELTGIWDDENRLVEKVAWSLKSARLFGGALILIVTNDRAELHEPLDITKPFEILNLVTLDKNDIHCEEWEEDLTSPGFGEPLLWRSTSSDLIHSSRLVYFNGTRVSRKARKANRGFDDSVLRRAMGAIRNKTSIDQSRATLVQDFKTDILRTKNLDVIGTADEQLDYFENRLAVIAKSKSNINMILLDEGEDFQKNTTSVAGLADLDRAAADELTTSSRMPRARFFGEAPGGLNSDGDSQLRNWHSQVSSFQTNELQRPLRQLYSVILNATNGPTKGKEPSEWWVEFNDLEDKTELQIAQLRKLVAETDAIYLDRGVIDNEQVIFGRFGTEGWRLELPSIEETEALLSLAAGALETVETEEPAPAAGPVAALPEEGINEQ